LSFSVAELRRLIKEGLSLGLAQMVWAFHQYGPIILVAHMVGENETAWFGAAHRTVLSLLTFSWLYHFNLFPTMARRVHDSKVAFNALLRASYHVVAWVGILVALVLTLLAQPIIEILFGQPYTAAATSFAILVWILPVTALGGHARWSLVAAGRQQYVLVAQIAGAIGMAVGGVILISNYHAVGAAITMLIATLLVWFTAHFCMTRYVGTFSLFGGIGSPALLAVLAGFMTHLINSSVWISAAITALLFIALTPLIDSKLYLDFRRLANAKA
jgi:O-antigen/teichoic acid export membrane protein